MDHAAMDELSLHGHSLNELVGFLPVGLNPTSAPFIHHWLKTGVEDLNQLVSAIDYLAMLIRSQIHPGDPFLLSLCKLKRATWHRTVLLNARLVKAAKQKSFGDLQMSSALDALTSNETPFIRYKKDAFGARLAAEPFDMRFFENRASFRVTGFVSRGAYIDNIPYINSNNRLIVRENGQWVEMDGDWSPVSVDINPDGTFKKNDMNKPIWLDPSAGIVCQILGKVEYENICRSVQHASWDWGKEDWQFGLHSLNS